MHNCRDRRDPSLGCSGRYDGEDWRDAEEAGLEGQPDWTACLSKKWLTSGYEQQPKWWQISRVSPEKTRKAPNLGLKPPNR